MEPCPFYVSRERTIRYDIKTWVGKRSEPILDIYRGCYHPHSNHRPGVIGSVRKSTCGGDFKKCQINEGPGINWAKPNAYVYGRGPHV